MPRLLAAVLALVVFTPAAWANPGQASEPIRVVEDSLRIPAGMDTELALSSVDDITRIFELYEPVIPKIPGVRIALRKTVVSSIPAVLELPVTGNAIGYPIDERAKVTAVAQVMRCGPDGQIGRKITLDFEASSYNVERRIDRIEITACPAIGRDGTARIDTVGRMYAGFKPEDPELNGLSEAIGAKALQTAFIKQVPAVLRAVRRHWADVLAG